MREVECDTALPKLKRAKISLSGYGHSDVGAALPRDDQPVVRDATGEEAAAKRVRLTEPDAVDDLGDMDTVHVPKKPRLQVGDVNAGSSKLACDSCGEEFCMFWVISDQFQLKTD